MSLRKTDLDPSTSAFAAALFGIVSGFAEGGARRPLPPRAGTASVARHEQLIELIRDHADHYHGEYESELRKA
jgi:hypothetical protein